MARKRELTIEEIEELKRKPILTTTDIARLAGCTRQTAHNWAVEEKIPAKRVKRYKGQYRFHNSAKFRAWCEKKRQERVARAARQQRKAGLAAARGFPFLKHFWKADEAIDNGNAPSKPPEKLQFYFEPFVRSVIELCGADWMNKLR
jgi:hypothetical protein